MSGEGGEQGPKPIDMPAAQKARLEREAAEEREIKEKQAAADAGLSLSEWRRKRAEAAESAAADKVDEAS